MNIATKLNNSTEGFGDALDKLNEAAVKRIRAGLPLTDEKILELKRVVEAMASELVNAV